MHKRRSLLAAACLIGLAAGAQAATVQYKATLDSASEVPPNQTGAKGTFVGNLDPSTGMMSYTLNYQGLSGPATMAHIHGPAAPGQNAGVITPLNPAGPSPASGTVQLTGPQVEDLNKGMYYVNVHTAAHPGGELRGQLMRAQ